MKTALVKTSKVIKSGTEAVRQHFDILDRAREIYLSQMKKAEADYFERLRRATEMLNDAENEAAASPIEQPAPMPAQ
jgi:hypothetical protein